MAFGTQKIYTSGAYKASDVIEAAPLAFQLATGFNPTGVTVYVLFFDLLAVPGAGAVPKYPIQVPAGGSFSWAPGALVEGSQEGEPFDIGCCFAVSSTGNLYTVSALAIWLDVEGKKRT
jgi:hypothetical protein